MIVIESDPDVATLRQGEQPAGISSESEIAQSLSCSAGRSAEAWQRPQDWMQYLHVDQNAKRSICSITDWWDIWRKEQYGEVFRRSRRPDRP